LLAVETILPVAIFFRVRQFEIEASGSRVFLAAETISLPVAILPVFMAV
jgi:hypothetical protein